MKIAQRRRESPRAVTNGADPRHGKRSACPYSQAQVRRRCYREIAPSESCCQHSRCGRTTAALPGYTYPQVYPQAKPPRPPPALHSRRRRSRRKLRSVQAEVCHRLPVQPAVGPDVLALLKLLDGTACLGSPAAIGRSGMESVVVERLLHLSDFSSRQVLGGDRSIIRRAPGVLRRGALLTSRDSLRSVLRLRVPAGLLLRLLGRGLLLPLHVA